MPRTRILPKAFFISLVIFLSLSQASIVSAGSNIWTTNGPAGETIFTLAINPVTPATVYGGATDGGGVYKSTNSGGSWSSANTGLTDTEVYALAVDPVAPSTLYAGTFTAGVFKSTNSGGNWSAINTGLTAAEIVSLAIDPVTHTTLYAGTWGGGVFKSINSGGNWSSVNIGLTDSFVHDLAIDRTTPSTLYAGTLTSGVFKSTDGGGSWTAVSAGLGELNIRDLAINPSTPTTLYAGTWGDGVYKSTNGGGSWSAINTGLSYSFIVALAIDPATPTTIYAGTVGGVYVSMNGGVQWYAYNTGLYTDMYSLAINPVTPTILFGGTGKGVYSIQSTAPAIFNKTGPANGSGVSTSPTLTWSSSSNAVGYEFCYDTTNNNACDTSWSSAGFSNSTHLSGLGNNTTYYWQVRSINPAGSSYANSSTWWSFKTPAVPPGAFVKSAPANASTQTINPSLSWTTSSGAVSYELCIDTTDNNVCNNSWLSVGASTSSDLIGLSNSTTYYWQIRAVNPGGNTQADGGTWWSFTTTPPAPGAFGKSSPIHLSIQPLDPTLSWAASTAADDYEYCIDSLNNDACDTSWVSAGSSTSAGLSGLSTNTTYYWQVRANNAGGTTYADSGTWWSFKTPIFADVPFDHAFRTYIEAFYNAGITTGCGTGPLIFCPDTAVTRAAMAVFLLRAKYGSSYAPPPASHTFADVPFTGKEWMEPWIDQFYLEGITTGCGADPLIYCPENTTTRAAMAVFILRAKYGSSYTPPAASHFFSDLPVAGKEWMEPWVDELYREGITSGCGTGPLIYCPENSVKRQAMAAFIVRAFNLPMP